MKMGRGANRRRVAYLSTAGELPLLARKEVLIPRMSRRYKRELSLRERVNVGLFLLIWYGILIPMPGGDD